MYCLYNQLCRPLILTRHPREFFVYFLEKRILNLYASLLSRFINPGTLAQGDDIF